MKTKFSKLLLLSSALLLASCGGELSESVSPSDVVVNSDLQDAADYYYQTIKDDKTSLQSYDLNSSLFIGGVSYTVTWELSVTSGDAGTVRLGTVNDEGRVPVTIDFDKAQLSETSYTLTCTVTDKDGNSTSFELNRNVPKFTFVDYNKWIEACAAGSDEVISVKAYVVGAIGKESSSSFGSLYLQDADGRGYYAYAPKLDSSIKTRDQLNAAFPAGTEVIVSGTATNYSGQHEFNKGCSVTATGNTAASLGVELDYTNATEAFATAADAKDASKLDLYQNARVTLENCKLGSIDTAGGYYYFTVGDGTAKYNIYKTNYFLEDAALEEALANFTSGYTATITGIVSCYSNSYQIYPDSIESIKITSAEVSDEAKVDLGLDAVSKEYGVKYNKSQTIDLPETDDAGIAYTYAVSGDGIALDDNGNLVVTQSDVETTNTLTVTAKLGSVEKSVELTIIVASAMPNFASLAEVVTLEDGTDVAVVGTVKEINTEWSDQYGNITVTITDGTNDFYLYRLGTKVEVGDNILVTGTVGSYKGAKQLAQGGKAFKFDATGLTSIPDALASEDGTEVKFFGMVNEINTEWSDQYGNITVTVEDVDGNEFYLYRLSTNVKVGDFAVFTGKVGSYKGAKQLAQGGTAEVLGAEVAPEIEYVEMDLATALGSEDGTAVIVTGTVKSIDSEWSDQYNNMTVTITDGTNDLSLFRIGTKVEIGDELKVKGVIGSYNGVKQTNAGAEVEVLEPEVGPLDGAIIVDYVSEETTNMTGENDAALLGLDESWTVVGLNNGNNNFPGLNKAGQLRLYSSKADGDGNTVTFTNTSTIVKIKINFVEGYDDSVLNVIVGDTVVVAENGIYTINANSFTLKNVCVGASTQVRIDSIEVVLG